MLRIDPIHAAYSAGVLAPAGPVGRGERLILIDSVVIMLAIVLPTIVCTGIFAWWFRASNPRARHRPNFDYSGRLELLVWSVPALVVLFLGGVAWVGSHTLDPAQPLAEAGPALEVQVVSMDWKWLFIYPGTGVASVNLLEIPSGRPVHFHLTSATVMNSFFVPQLGSQIYTMAGMETELYLQADRPGRFMGMSAQFSGDGFSDMYFTVEAVPQAEFGAWLAASRRQAPLDAAAYRALAAAANHVRVDQPIFGNVAAHLFDEIVHLREPAAPAVQP
jgi:cytochrome o ubiquinol oxidase subunit 2